MNRSGVRTESAVAKRDILFCTDPVVAVGVRVNATGLPATTDDLGRKVIKAGTALGGDTSALTNRQTELRAITSTAGNPIIQGVTQHDIYFYPNETVANANMIIFGFIDTNKMEADARPNADIVAALVNRVTFINGR